MQQSFTLDEAVAKLFTRVCATCNGKNFDEGHTGTVREVWEQGDEVYVVTVHWDDPTGKDTFDKWDYENFLEELEEKRDRERGEIS